MASAALSSSFLAARPRVIGVAKSGRRPAVRGPVRVAAAGSTIASVSLNDNVDFYQVRALIRPWRLEKVVAELNAYGITGLTSYDVQGKGVQAGTVERYHGNEFGNADPLVEKTCIEVVLCREQVQDVVDIIVEAAQTGEIGDGKIFLYPVADVIRIRTGEVGAAAERMAGGHEDMVESRMRALVDDMAAPVSDSASKRSAGIRAAGIRSDLPAGAR